MVCREHYGTTPEGKDVTVVSLKNEILRVELLSYGATIDRVFAPDRAGNIEQVLVTFSSLEERIAHSAYQGEIVGRYANRIAGGKFSLHDQEYHVTINENDVTHLHGGGEFSHAVWDIDEVEETTVLFSYRSPAGAEGFPGAVQARVRYTLADSAVVMDYWAESDADTVFCMTNHAYFNLAGQGNILGHRLQIHATEYLPTDALSIPTGEIAPVSGTVFDFTQPKEIGADVDREITQLTQCKGYDHTFCLKKSGIAAVVTEPATGRTLTVETDQPAILLYTGNYLEAPFVARQGFCLETQVYPNSPNQPGFTDCVLRAGEVYETTTKFIFGVSSS